MLMQILASVSVNAPLHMTDVTYIEFITNVYTTSTSNITHLPTYERFHRHLLSEKEEKKNWSQTRNI